MATETIEKSTRKTLVSQTSEVLAKKLEEGKLFGISKKIAEEILEARKTKAKKNGTAVKDKKEAVDKKSEVKQKKEVKKQPKQELSFEPMFEVGSDVKFKPYRQDKEIKGTVVRSYIVTLKNSGKQYEAVKIKDKDGKTYEKAVSKVSKV